VFCKTHCHNLWERFDECTSNGNIGHKPAYRRHCAYQIGAQSFIVNTLDFIQNWSFFLCEKYCGFQTTSRRFKVETLLWPLVGNPQENTKIIPLTTFSWIFHEIPLTLNGFYKFFALYLSEIFEYQKTGSDFYIIYTRKVLDNDYVFLIFQLTYFHTPKKTILEIQLKQMNWEDEIQLMWWTNWKINFAALIPVLMLFCTQ
jgi:hypothetical protein